MPFLTTHILRSVPFSNLNRDDYGDPKSLVYGGAVRSRWSSQAISRPLRHYIEEQTGDFALRTRRIPQQLARILSEKHGWSSELAANAARQVFHSVGIKTDSKGARVLAFIPASAIEQLADLCHRNRGDIEASSSNYPAPEMDVKGKEKALEPKKGAKPGVASADVSTILRSVNGSVSLFGRMLSELPNGSVDAARQMAHGFTTHGVTADGEDDFFTAVDDLMTKEDGPGSGHMNHATYTAGSFYQYATLDLGQLLTNLGGDTESAEILVRTFIEGFIKTLPGGKHAVTAPQTVPDLVHVQVRMDGPLSFAPAFEAPVQARGAGWALPSREALASYAARLGKLIDDGPDNVPFSGYASIHEGPLEGLGKAFDSYYGSDGLTGVATAALMRAESEA